MKQARGFTLVELIVVMTVMAILLAITVPSFQYISTRNRLASTHNALLGTIMFARAEAIKRGVAVYVCGSTDGTGCDKAGIWRNGWITYFNPDTGSGNLAVLRREPPLTHDDGLTGPADPIAFNREGFASGLPANAMFVLQDRAADPQYTRCLSLNLIGQATTLAKGEGACR